ncbi:glycosyltransferase family 4 protein [Candidatus Mycolicibacterium alkanivorans]|uniref:Glycosyltransferase family 4 protein n=1 Tax=Candidatus Mycolicibacterium alkanivorans TaxID=2954114 RepID=A0ABS9Z018_9MYCO|nr:glycosyltransferase family 4 protein [Candidatus Mycolicibacterium alkanivorans]MCI4675909.1 glycosyltransferase family 4 protein [Candidatus Mycolicibacterium alkanivorans]
MHPLRIAAFGFRSYPPSAGSAGADKFAMELLPRLAARGHKVTAYSRRYPGVEVADPHYTQGVDVITFRTTSRSGFDTILHSAKVTWDIIRHNRADVVHIQNGGNSIFGAVLRLFGKKTFVSQDGLDWQRDKWSWYAKVFLWLSSLLTAHVHNAVIFDNIYAREAFETRFKKKYDFIPFGADVKYDEDAERVLQRLGLERGDYFLFVGRFIPDKGLHWLLPAFEALDTDKKLVLVGGSPNGSAYEEQLRETEDPRVVFAGFLYGSEVHALMRNSYAYVQPSAIEGLSPVILEAAYVGAPIVCSDIPQNHYGIAGCGTYFGMGDVVDLTAKLKWTLDAPADLAQRAADGSRHVAKNFSWDTVVDKHVEVFGR